MDSAMRSGEQPAFLRPGQRVIPRAERHAIAPTTSASLVGWGPATDYRIDAVGH